MDVEKEPGLLSPSGVLADVELTDGTVLRGGVRLERKAPDEGWIYHMWDVTELEEGRMGEELVPSTWIPADRVKLVNALTHEKADRYEEHFGFAQNTGLRLVDEDEDDGPKY